MYIPVVNFHEALKCLNPRRLVVKSSFRDVTRVSASFRLALYHKGANVKKRTALVSALRRALWENQDNLGSAVTSSESYKSIQDGASSHLHNPCGVIILTSEFLFIYGRKLKNNLHCVEPERFVVATLWLPYKAAECLRFWV